MKNKEITYSVGQLAKILKVSVCTLQRYDNQNLLPAHRNEKGRRYYVEEDIEKFNSVRKNYVGVTEEKTYTPTQFGSRIKVSANYLSKIEKIGAFMPCRNSNGYRYFTELHFKKWLRHSRLNTWNMDNFDSITEIYLLQEFATLTNISVTKLRKLNQHRYPANYAPSRKYFYTNIDLQNIEKYI